MSIKDESVRITLRLPPALHKALMEQAVLENRSLNSEIIQRLDDSLLYEVEAEMRRSFRDEMKLLRLDAALLKAALSMPSRDEILKRMEEKQLEPMSPEGYQAYLLFIAPKRDPEAELEKIRNEQPKPSIWK